MAVIDLKISNAVSQELQLLDSDTNPSLASSLDEILNSILYLQQSLTDNYTYFDSWKATATTLTTTFSDGTTITTTGVLTPTSNSGGSFSATSRVLSNTQIKQSATGTFLGNYTVDAGYLSYAYSSQLIKSYEVSILDSNISSIGKSTIGFTGNVGINENDDMSGTVNTFSIKAEKGSLASATFTGAFNLSGNTNTGVSFNSGTLTALNQQYRDGSYIKMSGNLDASLSFEDAFASASFLSGNDTVSLDLPVGTVLSSEINT